MVNDENVDWLRVVGITLLIFLLIVLLIALLAWALIVVDQNNSIIPATEERLIAKEQPLAKKQQQENPVLIGQEFLVFLEKLSQDESQRQRYLYLVEKLSCIVSAEAKKNPAEMSSFIEEVIPLIPKAGHGVALQVEEYASEALRKEMVRLRQESGVIELKKIEKETGVLKARLENMEKYIIAKDAEIERLKLKVEPSEDDVPVVFRSTASGIVGFKFLNVASGQHRLALIGVGEYNKTINLQPGEYEVIISQNGKNVKQQRLHVKLEPSVEFKGKWYHGFVEH